MEALLFLVVALIILLLGLPIWALISTHGQKRRNEDLEWRLRNLENEVNRLREGLTPGPQATQAPEPEEPKRTQPMPAIPVAAPPIIPIAESQPVPQGQPIFAQAAPAQPVSRPEPAAPPPIPQTARVEQAPSRSGPPKPVVNVPEFNWEQFMGVKLFAWVGGLAAFLAVAFFLKYSFEHNLIPPEVRVAAGFLTGIGLLIGGIRLSQKAYAVLSQTLCATGVVILYAVTFACRSIYHFSFFGVVPTFVLMVLITTTAFLLAVRMNAMVVVILGMLGGFLTPILLSTGQDNPLGLFGYIGLLDIGVIAVVLHRRWSYLIVLAALGTIAMQIGWAAEFFVPEKIYIAMAVLVGFAALFSAAYWLAQKRSAQDAFFAIAAFLLQAVAFGFAFYFLSIPEIATRPGVLFTFVFLIDLCVLGLVLLDSKLFPAQVVAGMLAFALLAIWTGEYLSDAFLNWALGICLLFALLHSAFPIVLRRLRPEMPATLWAHLFPAVALLVLMIPIFKLPSLSLLIWPSILLIDLIAVLLAVLSATILPIVVVLVLTFFATAFWLANVPAELTGLPASLFVIGGFAIVFFMVGIFATRKILARMAESPPEQSSTAWNFKLSPETAGQLPAMAGVLPFLLLMMMTLRLPLANPSPVFGLGLLLTVLLLGLARQFQMDWLPAVGLAGVLALEHVWHVHRFDSANPGWALGWYLGFYAVFTAFPFIFYARFKERILPWATAALAGPLHFYLVHNVIVRAWPNSFMGALPALFALPALGGLVFLLRTIPAENPRRISQLAWFGGVTLFFITLIFPIQFDRQWITLGWALEGAALLWLYHRVPHNGLRLTGIGLLIVVFVRLAFNPSVLHYHLRSETPILNWYLYTYGIAAACYFIGARLLAPPRHLVWGKSVLPLLYTLGTILVFLLVNIEIADYFSEGTSVTFNFSRSLACDMSYTIAWALFAFVLLVIGVWKQVRAARYCGVGLLLVTLLKLFFHDLANLANLYRVGALLGVAIIVLLASFIYQKFLPKIMPPSGNTNESPKS